MKLAIPTLSVSRAAGRLFFSVRRLAQELLLRHDLRCSVFGPRDSFAEQDLKHWAPLRPVTYPVRGPMALGYSADLGHHLDRFRPEIIHSHGIWMYYSLASSRWSRRAHVPHIVSPRGMLDPWALAHKTWKKRLAGCLYENRSLRAATCLHALNQSEYESIRRYGLKSPVCVIPNGIDVPTHDAEVHRGWGTLGFPQLEGRKVLLYLGRLHPKKGLPALLHAWAETKRRTREDWTLAIAGWDQGNHERQLAGLITDLAINDTVLLIGPQFDKSKDACFRQADGFILPSVSEGLPMVVLEAWSYGLPVIMTPECNLPGGFQANAAVRIETRKESIRCGLERFFLLSERERQRMGNNGLEVVKQRYSWASAAKQMRSVYEWAIGGGSTPDCVVTN